MCQEAILEVSIKVTGIQNKIRIFFEEIDGEWLSVAGIDEIVVYFVNSEEVLPFIELISILRDFGVEFFGDAVERKTVVGGEDELLF